MQGSLLDLGDDVGLAPLSGHVTRTELAHGAWIDHRPSWITASDTVLEHLLHEVTWVAERRRMYDRVVDVPRLIAWYDAGDALPHDVLVDARSALSTYYRPELGEPFVDRRQGVEDPLGDLPGRGDDHDHHEVRLQ